MVQAHTVTNLTRYGVSSSLFRPGDRSCASDMVHTFHVMVCLIGVSIHGLWSADSNADCLKSSAL